jgi:GntR family transcriptional repressor for pyruvate dehydrogenase complex
MSDVIHAVGSRKARLTAAERVVAWVRRQIVAGTLKPGQRLPPERDLAVTIGVSRPSVRAGLRTLATMRVIVVRHGAGSYVADGPPRLDGRSLGVLSALHGFTPGQLRHTRELLESEAATLAARNATPEQLEALADSVAESLAGLSDRRTRAAHDITFHAAIAAASGNPVLALLVDLVARLESDGDHHLAAGAGRQRQDALSHERIYRALRRRNASQAQAEMRAHLASPDSITPPATYVPSDAIHSVSPEQGVPVGAHVGSSSTFRTLGRPATDGAAANRIVRRA